MPVAGSAVASAGLSTVQVPPLVDEFSVVVCVAHTVVVPVIADGNGFTTTAAVTEQPVVAV